MSAANRSAREKRQWPAVARLGAMTAVAPAPLADDGGCAVPRYVALARKMITRSALGGCEAMRLAVPVLMSAVVALFAGCSRDQPGPAQGSPPKEESVVIFRAADGRTLTMADLRGLSGT